MAPADLLARGLQLAAYAGTGPDGEVGPGDAGTVQLALLYVVAAVAGELGVPLPPDPAEGQGQVPGQGSLPGMPGSS